MGERGIEGIKRKDARCVWTEGTLVCDPEVGQEEELAAGPMGKDEFECLSGVGNPGWRPCCGPAGTTRSHFL